MKWWPIPEAGDIVWCHFPQDKKLKPGPKPRPALIVKVFDDHAPRFYAEVAYGTSQKTDRLHPGEFLITRRDGAAWQISGLSYETKFNFSQTVELPYDSEWFGLASGTPYGQNPKLGLLHPSLLRRAQAAWSASRTKKRQFEGLVVFRPVDLAVRFARHSRLFFRFLRGFLFGRRLAAAHGRVPS